MEAASHHTICGIERLFDTVTVVTVDIDVQNTGERAEKLQNTEYNIVDITKPRCFALFCVVKAACPVYGDVSCARANTLGSSF